MAEDVLRGDSDHRYCRKIEADLTTTAGVDEQTYDKPNYNAVGAAINKTAGVLIRGYKPHKT